jgi:hypothetical protein
VPITVYHYSEEDYADGQIIWQRGDHYDRLTATEKQVERAIREKLQDGERVRRTSLYTWEDESLARRLCELRKKEQKEDAFVRA